MNPGSASLYFLVAFALSDSPCSLSPNFRVILLRMLLYHTGEEKAKHDIFRESWPGVPSPKKCCLRETSMPCGSAFR
jgi:hypothetical protein